MKMMTVDIIIPTYKPDKKFLQLIERLSLQTVKARRIIVLNTEEKYFERLIFGTDFLEKYRNVEVYHHSKREFDHGRTRNSGVKRSDADAFICMTQDAVPENDRMTEELLKGLSGEGVAAAYARQLAGPESGILERFTREFNYPDGDCVKSAQDLERLGIKTYFCSNVCAAYDRKIFERLGGFIRHTIFNEDMIYAAKAVKAGYRIAYASGARVVHSHNYTNGEQFRRNFDLGVSQADHPEVFRSVPAESEGVKMVRTAARYLKRNKMSGRIPGLYVQSACKYAGFQLGKHYRRLPKALIMRCTMDKEYWQRDMLVKASGHIDPAAGYGRTDSEREMRSRTIKKNKRQP